MSTPFFDEMSDQSEVKSQIVADYFGAWTTIMARKSRSDKLAYIDLFSGPGRYSDGKILLLLKWLKKSLRLQF